MPEHILTLPNDGSEPDPTSKADDRPTAETSAKRALAEQGITTHHDDDAGNTWLVIAHDQTRPDSPNKPGDPYAVLYLYNEASDDGEEEITVTRAPMTGDHWHVLTCDGTGTERELITLPADQLPACVEAITAWVTDPRPAEDNAQLRKPLMYSTTVPSAPGTDVLWQNLADALNGLVDAGQFPHFHDLYGTRNDWQYQPYTTASHTHAPWVVYDLPTRKFTVTTRERVHAGEHSCDGKQFRNKHR
ncbi:hypothetical protein ACFYY1_39155 [Streptomyces sp. NPDC001890]|uniref:hypothetical protein n=1 Tax=Streptomyces sp. NPDC001890 TaxID=3364620 RepID=UPI00368B066D